MVRAVLLERSVQRLWRCAGNPTVLVLLLSGLGLAVGCKADREARVNLSPLTPLAEGAFFPLTVTDACKASPKLPVCMTERLDSIDNIGVDDWSILQIVRMSELPTGMQVQGAPLALYGVSPGIATIRIESTFDDDTQRDIEQTVAVERATRQEISHRCFWDDPDVPNLFPTNATVALRLVLYRGDTVLAGEHPLPLSGPGLERLEYQEGEHRYTWTSPATPGTTTLRSPVFPRFGYELQSYEPDALEIEELALSPEASELLAYDRYVRLEPRVSVAKKLPCAAPDLFVQTLTPEICVGQKGVESWSATLPNSVGFRARATGTCELSITVEGASDSQIFEYQLEVEAIPDALLPCADASCDEVPEPCPQGYGLGMTEDGCCAECQAVPDPELCEAERSDWDPLYESALEGAAECIFDSDCTLTVLVAGCRRYCEVPLSGEGIANFMNAISSAYYIGCPHCIVEDPAACDGMLRPYCGTNGQCSLAALEP